MPSSMYAEALKKMIKKFEETDFFEVKSGRGKKSVVSTFVEDAATALQKGKKKDE